MKNSDISMQYINKVKCFTSFIRFVICFMFGLISCVSAYGEITIMASREYVDKRVILKPAITNDGRIVGVKIGVQNDFTLLTSEALELISGIPDNALVWTNNNIQTKDGKKKISAEDIGVYDNPAFSNAVLSVGLNISTNDVAAIGAMVDIILDFPIDPTTGATTLGGLLAALAAAVAWLKRNKLSKPKQDEYGNWYFEIEMEEK